MKKFSSVLVLALMIAAPGLAQTNSDICIQAEIDARGDVNSWLWMGVGCVFNLIGVGVAYLYKATPPPERLLGKPPEYVSAYTDCYVKQARKSQGGKAWIGCGVSGGVTLVAGTIILIAAADAASTACSDAASTACSNACSNMTASACSRGW